MYIDFHPAQLIMNSNHAPNFIEPDDRRFVISKWETTFNEGEENKEDYFTNYVRWLEREDGYAAIAHLLNSRDISKVQLSAPAMMTEEKEQVTTLMADPAVAETKAESLTSRLIWLCKALVFGRYLQRREAAHNCPASPVIA